MFRLENRLFRKLNSKWFGGVQWNYYKVFDVQQKEEGILETERPAGWNGYTASGIGAALVGAALVMDTRDLVVNPSKGGYLELSSLLNGTLSGSGMVP